MFFTQKIIHLVRTQKFPKNYHFLRPVMYTNQFLSGIKKFWLSEDFVYVLNGRTPTLQLLKEYRGDILARKRFEPRYSSSIYTLGSFI